LGGRNWGKVAGNDYVRCHHAQGEYMVGLLWTIIVILFVFWLLGFLLHFGGGLIHLILLIVVILIVVNLITGRGARV
jgi:hypothetical protein